MTLLEARDLHYRHSAAAAEAVAGVSLQVKAGEVVGVIGPNAAGKSTLARVCCGLLTAQSGEVRLQGDPLRWPSSRSSSRTISRSLPAKSR